MPVPRAHPLWVVLATRGRTVGGLAVAIQSMATPKPRVALLCAPRLARLEHNGLVLGHLHTPLLPNSKRRSKRKREEDGLQSLLRPSFGSTAAWRLPASAAPRYPQRRH
jgi:hypothetical protein